MKLIEKKLPRPSAKLCARFEESPKLEKAAKAILRGSGYGG